jgi:hypothetical protein
MTWSTWSRTAAVLNAAKKLEALGPELGYPHSSAVRDAIVSGSCGHAEAEVPGERSIVGLAMLSTLARITAGTGIESHLDVSNGAVVHTA